MANNGFSINVGTILDASNIPKDLEKTLITLCPKDL